MESTATSVTKVSLQAGGYWLLVWPGDGWTPLDVLLQDVFGLNEYLSIFPAKYIEKTGYVLSFAATL